ncbi:MBL fold metallo-hydrolase [Microlunatus endophyticus]|uniref:MBL fold metallo-hydrolase n=1 Tax=Microlunatus endophyticus TaxID=1716077 RepID=A0A917SCQ7_9ACTN|nr:MBL fold metallo-hydrolase [Microlunatus endophyticus]GGL72931.1 MBL fold metallo-hydrolase [Microlunatus endophyticus]
MTPLTGSMTQAPGFSRTRLGNAVITTVYDGALPILATSMHDEDPERIRELLADECLPPDGEALTAVNTFLFESGGRLVLVDAGVGTAFGPGTGHLMANLEAAGVHPADVDDILITHLHADHVYGVLAPGGTPAFPRAIVRAATLEADFWLDPQACPEINVGPPQTHQRAVEALAPYRASGRFQTFAYGEQPVPGITAVDLHGHTPGHAGYLLDAGATGVLFWGDMVHNYAVQLPAPHVVVSMDNDRSTAHRTRARALDEIHRNGWVAGGTHLPFPGLGRVQVGHAGGFRWVPAPYRPV